MKFSYLFKGVVASVFGAAMLLTGGTAQADYPCKEATFIVPYSPGGGSDQMARRLVPGLEEALGVGVRYISVTISCILTLVIKGISPELFIFLKYFNVGSYPHSS